MRLMSPTPRTICWRCITTPSPWRKARFSSARGVQSRLRRLWIYLNRRFIDQYDERGDRYTMEKIATELRVSCRTLSRHRREFVRDFVLAFPDPNRPSGIS